METHHYKKPTRFLTYIIYKGYRTNNRTKCKFSVNECLFLIELYMIAKIFQHKNFGNKIHDLYGNRIDIPTIFLHVNMV